MSEATFRDPSAVVRGDISVAWMEGIEFLEVPGTSATFAARVFHYIDPSGDCWEWTGATNKGYGVIGRGGRGAGLEQAHRAVWQLLVDSIPSGMEYDHLCRNHVCCNPDHGEIVTPEENKRRGFGLSILNAKRTTCKFGHPLDGVTTRKTGETSRYCKTCARAKSNIRHAAKRKAA